LRTQVRLIVEVCDSEGVEISSRNFFRFLGESINMLFAADLYNDLLDFVTPPAIYFTELIAESLHGVA
jgi:hypothetical protein